MGLSSALCLIMNLSPSAPADAAFHWKQKDQAVIMAPFETHTHTPGLRKKKRGRVRRRSVTGQALLFIFVQLRSKRHLTVTASFQSTVHSLTASSIRPTSFASLPLSFSLSIFAPSLYVSYSSVFMYMPPSFSLSFITLALQKCSRERERKRETCDRIVHSQNQFYLLFQFSIFRVQMSLRTLVTEWISVSISISSFHAPKYISFLLLCLLTQQ